MLLRVLLYIGLLSVAFCQLVLKYSLCGESVNDIDIFLCMYVSSWCIAGRVLFRQCGFMNYGSVHLFFFFLLDPQYYSDAYILSAECSPSSINVAISFNQSTESDPDDYDLYSLAINCSGNITVKFLSLF